MKKVSTVAAKWVVLSVLAVGFSTWATGQPGTQGPRFLGLGLDQPVPNFDGSLSPGQIQSYTLVPSASFPPHDETQITLVGSALFTITNLECKLPRHLAGTPLPYAAHCRAYVSTNLGNQKSVCLVNDATTHLVDLVAINAGWNSAASALDFNASNAVVFACWNRYPTAPDLLDRIGAFGKCTGWGFASASQSEFNACVRAARADYCGTGASYTRAGTPFVVYDGSATNQSLCRPGECFEASWGTNGATCINHLRYEALLQLAQAAQYTQGGAADAGTPDAGGTGSYNAGQTPISIDGLQGCSVPTSPLATCLSKYTDFYYDDQHPMNLVNLSAVDSISAQYVCLSGQHRKFPQGLLSRTKVRFTTGSGTGTTVTPLPCCDTLGCL
jgi:ADYC domain